MTASAQTNGWTRNLDLSMLVERMFAGRLVQFGWFLTLALLTRASTFGDPGYHNDELFYFLVGQRIHDGLLPYVDIWDRKGPGLFLIYYLIAAVSRAVVAYQAAACLFAAMTAMAANAIAERFTGRLGALLAGSLYLIMLPLFAGGGGQAPVFYNLFIALAALILFSRIARLRAGKIGAVEYLGMASAGFAITFKQTAAIEGMFFGCAILWLLYRGGARSGLLLGHALGLAFAGAAPMLFFAGLYLALGHFDEFWHAMVTANLAKTYNPSGDAAKRIGALALIATPLLLPALATLLSGLSAKRNDGSTSPIPRWLLAGWLGCALVGVAIIPNYIDHYMLPAMLPLAVIAAPALGWRGIGPAYALFAGLFALMAGPSLKFAERDASREAMAAIVSEIRARDPQPRLFIFQGPTYLYALLRSYPPSPLVFPVHLFHRPERNTSHLDTAKEVRKILAWQPTVVVRAHDLQGTQLNAETAKLVDDYISARCQPWSTKTITDYYGPQRIVIYGNCNQHQR